MTTTVNMIGSAKTLILPHTVTTADGVVSELRIYELDAKLEVGQRISPESIERLGLVPVVVLKMDSAEKAGAVAQQAHRMMQEQARQEAAFEQQFYQKERDEEMAHIEEMARTLADRQRAFNDKYGPAGKGPQHAANMDCYAHSLAETLAQALGGQVISLKV